MSLTPESVDNLRREAREAREAAYCPYSNFAVGAAVLCMDGSIYRGCNIENASFGLTVCAERTALFAAVCAGNMNIVAIALVTSAAQIARPCGACRQVIAEFSPQANPIAIISESIDGDYVIETLTDLLPGQFSLL